MHGSQSPKSEWAKTVERAANRPRWMDWRLPRSSRPPSTKCPPSHSHLVDGGVPRGSDPSPSQELWPDLSHVAERRQVLDMPEIYLVSQGHQIETICCPTCHLHTLGSFPVAVGAPVQYGPHLQALAVYLHQGQLLPTVRTCEALAEICGYQISEVTLIQ